MKRMLTIVFPLLFVLLAQSAAAVTLRYALIVGNNRGVDANGNQPFADLKHAETEAQKLKEQLIKLSNFDVSSSRTVLQTGITRDQLRAAMERLVRQKNADQALLGKVHSLFLFYFTGHGLQGRLLLEDGPLHANELAAMIRSMNAEFSVSIFDACHAGSLSPKGIRSTPGLNLFRELPQEVLEAKGSVWYVSSGPGQASYEDEKIGGVFTHFFIEALNRAPIEGPGITLDRVWHYARQKTVRYTADRKRRQDPQQHVAKLTSTAPIYFSFPLERSATIVLAQALQGQFALTYGDGQLTELIAKSKGRLKEVAVYPGQAQLSVLEQGKLIAVHPLKLRPHEKLVINESIALEPEMALGQTTSALWEKGMSNQNLSASVVQPGTTWLLGTAYAYDFGPAGQLMPNHQLSAKLRGDYASFWGALRLGWGTGRQEFEAWRYRAHAAVGELSVGYDWALNRTHLGLGFNLGVARLWQKYDDGAKRQGWRLTPAATASLLFGRPGMPVYWEVTASAGPTRTPGVGFNAELIWGYCGSVGVSIYFRLK